MKMNTLTTGILLALALWALPGLAADSELGIGQKRPWARGVSEADQTAAADLFDQGNALLENSLFMKAVEQYEQALRLWDHPSIHYNLALALVNLNEPLRLHHHLMEALRYDGQPLDASKLGRLKDLLKVVERQLVRVRITCDTPGATVQLDGTALFVGPGHHETFVLPGEYTFTVTREGYPPNERKRMGSAGEVLVLDYRLYTQEELTRYHRPWPAWRPWAVVGAGVALSGGGLLLHSRANEKYRLFDEAIARCSSANNGRGCLPSPEMLNDQSRGNTFQSAALGTFSVGGAALALGLTLAYFNRLQAEVISPDDHEKSLNITPVVGRTQNGVAATFSF
jgi:tetratricopeptide (TPR) repeat protein